MKLHSILGLVAAVLMLAGCSSTQTKVDTGPIHARTFSFVNRGQTPDYADDRQAAHAMIQAAITKDLAAHGVTRVASGGDVIVGYLVILGNNVSTEAINTYFGYSQGADALHDEAQKAYGSSKNPNYFEAGTLVIDIIDSRDYKLLRRQYATRPILQNITAEARAERIQGVVDEILANLRIVQ